MAETTTVALTGNTFIAQPVRAIREPRFLRTVELLRAADVTLTNLECAIPDPDDPPAFAAGSGWGATYMVGTPDMLDDLRYMGVDGVCAANNHVSDFGDAGILSTVAHLRAARMPYAGIGASLTEASEAGYVTSPTGLRVAFLVACDWGPRGALGLNFPWPHGYLASDEAPPFRSRPGVNLLRYEAVTTVTREELEQLRSISERLGWERDKAYRRNGFMRSHPLVGTTTNIGVEEDSETTVWFLGRKFVAGDEHGHRTVPCQEDLDRIFTHVREARRQADAVLVGLHDQSHGEGHDYVEALARGAIEAGADVFFNNGGTHYGVELHKGGVILHGLPSFFLQTEAVRHVPSSVMARFGLPATATAADFLDARERAAQAALAEGGRVGMFAGGKRGTAVHTCVFDSSGELEEIRVQPLEPLGGGIFDVGGRIPRFRGQMPLFPEPGSPVAAATLEHARDLSARLGTEMVVEDGVGVVRLR